MTDSDRKHGELVDELARLRRRLEAREAEHERSTRRDATPPGDPPAGPTRRDILKAAWMSPILLSIGFPSDADAGTAAPTTEWTTSFQQTTYSGTTAPPVDVVPLLNRDR